MSDGDRDPAEGRDAVDLIGVAPGISHRVECHFGAPLGIVHVRIDGERSGLGGARQSAIEFGFIAISSDAGLSTLGQSRPANRRYNGVGEKRVQAVGTE